jgi:hypothetical protein
VIVVERPSVSGVEPGRRTADENGSRNEPLQVSSSFQDIIEGWRTIRHSTDVICSDNEGVAV